MHETIHEINNGLLEYSLRKPRDLSEAPDYKVISPGSIHVTFVTSS